MEHNQAQASIETHIGNLIPILNFSIVFLNDVVKPFFLIKAIFK